MMKLFYAQVGHFATILFFAKDLHLILFERVSKGVVSKDQRQKFGWILQS